MPGEGLQLALLTVLVDQGFKELLAQVGQTTKRAGLDGAHQCRRADLISGENCGKLAFQHLSPSNRRLAIRNCRIHAVRWGEL